jgi:histone H3/H4
VLELAKHAAAVTNKYSAGKHDVGLVIPPGRVQRYLKIASKRVSVLAAVYLAAYLQSIATLVIEQSIASARSLKEKTVKAKNVKSAVAENAALHALFGQGFFISK